jgi:hypothetical protein
MAAPKKAHGPNLYRVVISRRTTRPTRLKALRRVLRIEILGGVLTVIGFSVAGHSILATTWGLIVLALVCIGVIVTLAVYAKR